MELQLKIVGFILVVLALIHAGFPKRFNWKTELAAVSLFNKEVMYVHTFFIALTTLLMGILCLYSTHDLIYTKLGHTICFGLFIFWGTRLFFQFFVYSSELWKDKVFERTIHILFAMLWTYLTVVFLMAAMG
jgi:hypothetical protein